MELLIVILVAAVIFGICFVFDKAFTKVFRDTEQHKSGLSVRFNKHYGSIGLVLTVLGIAALFSGSSNGMLLYVCGGILVVTGICLVVYYMTFGVFYDEESFVLTTFGKQSKTYRYSEIRAQQLYNSYGNIVIELYLSDGRTVQLQSKMEGVYPFLDKAFEGWLRQTGRRKKDCAFYAPENSCWFPPLED